MIEKETQQNSKIKILALFGESGVGKDTIQRWFSKNIVNTNKIISYTTRPKRDNEIDGKDYNFITKEKFLELIDKGIMYEYTIFNDWYYGTPKSALRKDKINIGVFNPNGIKNLLSHSDVLDVLPVWITVDDRTRLLRTLMREKTPDCYEICRRFIADKKDFENISFDHEIYLNDKIENSTILNRPKIKQFFS